MLVRLTLDDRCDVLVNVVVGVLVDGRADVLAGRLGRANGARVLVLRLEAVEEVAFLGRHLGLGLARDLGLDVVLVLRLLVDLVEDGLDAVLVVVLEK